jgi:2-polyprenyl-3-methyl-5-hydroxy-6-metoxy-1,4-benzoquinol methylase
VLADLHDLTDAPDEVRSVPSWGMTTTTQTTIDAAAAEEFTVRLIGIISDSALALMISIGHQVGLFDTMAGLAPSTSRQVADAAGLHERYVREWLGAMTTGRVVTYDPAARTYALPPEHAASLTRDAGPDNLGHVLQFIPMLANVEQQVIECFRRGGGVPYSSFERFHALMAEDSATVHDAVLVDGILPLVPDLPARLRDGIDVADVGCGQGHAICLLARAFPASRFTGYDFSAEAIAAGSAEATALGLANAAFEVCDVATLDALERYDLVTAFDAIHDQAHPAQVLANIAGALRPGGTFLMVDIKASSNLEDNIGVPLASFLYTVSTMHCMSVSLGLDGAGLGTVWGRQLATSMLADAGFGDVQVKEVEADVFNNYYIAQK